MQTSTQIAAHTHDDLRRKRQRKLIEALLSRAEHLPEADRTLLEAVYRDGASLTDVARTAMLGDPSVQQASTQRTARMLRRRLRRIVTRLTQPDTAAYFADGRSWPYSRRRVAHAILVQGLTQRAAADHLGISLHSVRRQLHEIRGIVDASRQRSSGAA